MNRQAADPMLEAARELFKTGTPPDGEPWRGGKVEVSMSFSGPEVVRKQFKTTPSSGSGPTSSRAFTRPLRRT